MLANEDHILKLKIVDEMEIHHEVQQATQHDVKILFDSYKKEELKEDVSLLS